MIAARQRLKPRQRRRLREVRLSVQWWAALTSVVAGLLSIPALVISLNALQLSQQQRQDALAQRVEDQRKEAQSKADADALAKVAFPNRVQIVDEPDGTIRDAWAWYVRNANSQRAYVYVLHRPNKQPTELWEFVVEPCSEGEIVLPESKSKLDTLGGSQALAIAKRDAVSTRQQVWTRPILSAKPQLIPDFSQWIGLETQPDGGISIEPGSLKGVRRGITPCT
ncbi:hypothetical protein ABT294_43735 [Nonomuraea sp. NPDC000554]|uniref:hypothetical protein n=1 Tax=Nonomuraea sp. NPDC000554 TaxID=3154259 RepID=UPI00333461EC